MSSLTTFVHDALAAGKTREEIRGVLETAGWRQDEVKDALAEFADMNFPVPVPRRKPSVSAREAFLHFVAFMTLYITAIGVGTLLFQLIALLTPEPLMKGSASEAQTREIMSQLCFGAASTIIAFPVYLTVTLRLQRTYRRDPSQRSSPIRKWLTYFTLLIVTIIAISDAITLLASLLGGELTFNMALKGLVVAGICGAIYGIYLPGLRQEEKEVYEGHLPQSKPA